MKKGDNRMRRINDEIMKEVSNIIRTEMKDPRIGVMISVLKVDTTSDLKYCKIYVSVLGDDKQKNEALEGLKSAQGFIRKQIAEAVNLRNTPELKFVLDDSLEYSAKISKLIKEVNANVPSVGENE